MSITSDASSPTTAPTGRVFIIEDDELVREGFEAVLAMEPGLEVCGTAGTGAEARTALPTSGADVALVDLTLPDIHGLDLVAELHGRHPDLVLLVVSAHDSHTYAPRAREAGALDYVDKKDIVTALIPALAKALASK